MANEALDALERDLTAELAARGSIRSVELSKKMRINIIRMAERKKLSVREFIARNKKDLAAVVVGADEAVPSTLPKEATTKH
ncbi:MAG: hypothetical protein RLZZ283_625 [Candidatus Parcubacteria bacterium]